MRLFVKKENITSGITTLLLPKYLINMWETAGAIQSTATSGDQQSTMTTIKYCSREICCRDLSQSFSNQPYHKINFYTIYLQTSHSIIFFR